MRKSIRITTWPAVLAFGLVLMPQRAAAQCQLGVPAIKISVQGSTFGGGDLESVGGGSWFARQAAKTLRQSLKHVVGG